MKPNEVDAVLLILKLLPSDRRHWCVTRVGMERVSLVCIIVSAVSLPFAYSLSLGNIGRRLSRDPRGREREGGLPHTRE